MEQHFYPPRPRFLVARPPCRLFLTIPARERTGGAVYITPTAQLPDQFYYIFEKIFDKNYFEKNSFKILFLIYFPASLPHEYETGHN